MLIARKVCSASLSLMTLLTATAAAAATTTTTTSSTTTSSTTSESLSHDFIDEVRHDSSG